jgi:hypothetical protein
VTLRLEPPDSPGIDLPAAQDWGKHGHEESLQRERTPEDLANPRRNRFFTSSQQRFGLAEVSCVTGGPDPLLLLREQAHKSMGELKASIPDAQTVVYEGSPSLLIVDTALDLNCQMIVMGTHGRSRLVHLLLGSVAEYVVRSGNVPVLTVSAH